MMLPEIYEAVNPNTIALVVRCVDRRFRKAHAGLIRKKLGLSPEEIWPVKQAGGAGALTRQTQMQSEFDTLTYNIELGVRHSPNLRHIILINHQDCRRYDSLVDRAVCSANPERDDMPAAIRLMARKYPNIEVSGYFAWFTDETQKFIRFEAIGAPCSLQKITQLQAI